jgi:hypothetical protein
MNVCERQKYAVENKAPGIILSWYQGLDNASQTCGAATMPNAQALELTHFYAVSFFKNYLSHDPTYGEYLTRAYAETNQLPAAVDVALLGDFNLNLVRDVQDIDLLNEAIRAGTFNRVFNLNRDRVLNENDRDIWVTSLARTHYGDGNLDGEFNSTDLTEVFRAGQYEDSAALNSSWVSGDWNGDGDFSTGDLLLAFQDGGYEVGPRVAVATVPEPTALGITILLGVCGVMRACRKT